jgi:DNA-directed RNA polymerase subunit K/omega
LVKAKIAAPARNACAPLSDLSFFLFTPSPSGWRHFEFREAGAGQAPSRRTMSDPTLIEEYPRDATLTQFEKILVATKRAKDLHRGTKMPLVDVEHKDTYLALAELKEHKIRASYREEEPSELPAPSAEEEEE